MEALNQRRDGGLPGPKRVPLFLKVLRGADTREKRLVALKVDPLPLPSLAALLPQRACSLIAARLGLLQSYCLDGLRSPELSAGALPSVGSLNTHTLYAHGSHSKRAMVPILPR